MQFSTENTRAAGCDFCTSNFLPLVIPVQPVTSRTAIHTEISVHGSISVVQGAEV
jgi:hypothetical protein